MQLPPCEGDTEGWTMVWSGLEQGTTHGVGALLSPPVARLLRATRGESGWAIPPGADGRLLVLRFYSTIPTDVIIAYAPTNCSAAADKDGFYAALSTQIAQTPAGHLLMVLGDFNAQLHYDPTTTGPAAPPLQDPSDNASRLTQLLASHGLVAANTFFAKPSSAQVPNPHATFFNRGNTNQRPCTYDYIMISRRFISSVSDVSVEHTFDRRYAPRPGALPPLPFESDHRLVTARLRLRLSRSWSARHSPSSPRRFFLEALADEEVATAFEAAFAAHLPPGHLNSPPADPETEDAILTHACNAASETVLGPTPPRPHPQSELTTQARARTAEAANALAALKILPPDSPMRPAAKFRLRMAIEAMRDGAKTDKARFIERISNQIAASFGEHRARDGFRLLRALRLGISAAASGSSGGVTDPATGRLALGDAATATAFRNHAAPLLAPPSLPTISPETIATALSSPHPSPPPPPPATPGAARETRASAWVLALLAKAAHVQAAADRAALAARVARPPVPPPPSPDAIPEEPEVDRGRQLLRPTSAGNSAVHARQLRAGGRPALAQLTRVIQASWRRLQSPRLPGAPPPRGIPDAWRSLDLIYLYKSKARHACSNYRGISLINVPCKVHTMIVQERVKAQLEASLSPTQFGFRPGRGTPDAVFTLRQLQHAALRSRSPLYVAYIDLKSAFDTVSREGLWTLLSQHGIHPTLIALIQDLYADNSVQVRVGASRSPPITTTIGVRQGCPLSPLLFNLFIDLVARRLEALHPDLGASVRVRSNGDRLAAPSHDSQAHTLRRILQILYADDMALVATSMDDLRTLLLSAESIFTSLGLTVNYGKTKFQQLGHPAFSLPSASPPLPLSISLAHGTIDLVLQFRYLGSIMSSIAPDTPCEVCGSTTSPCAEKGPMLLCDQPGCGRGLHLGCCSPALQEVPGGHWACPSCPPFPPGFKPPPQPTRYPLDAEVAQRISAASGAFHSLSKVWGTLSIPLRIKLQFYNAFVISALLYCSATWALRPEQLQKFEVFHNTCLRRIKGLPFARELADGSYRTVPIAELHASGIRTHPISDWIDQLRLSFMGHLARRDESYLPKAMMFSHWMAQASPQPGHQPRSFVDVAKESLMHALGKLGFDRVGIARIRDSPLWLRLAGYRVWWRAEIVDRARDSEP
jgi:hypothetical protein